MRQTRLHADLLVISTVTYGCCVCAQLCERFGVPKEAVLLIDDDVNNCSAFAAEGGVALRVLGDQGFDFAGLQVT